MEKAPVVIPDRNTLLAQVVEAAAPGAPSSRPPGNLPALVDGARDARVGRWFHDLQPLLPPTIAPELAEFLRFALLGVCVGFSDRELSPYIAEHRAIIPLLLDDIRAVYEQLQALGTPYDRDDFRFRAYDYGIHKAYYLDWTLYMSHEPY
ncbi:MAG: hypothetical protein HY423_03800 [Candidatus Lambdaproteobacteria bacterium]|nr:hypothetical protein [Candidatus Lambdaproteobacteria bacterium]